MATIGKTIDDYKAEYNAAKARGDAAGMQAANNGANAIRTSQGQAAEYATVDIAKTAAANKPSQPTQPSAPSGNGTYTPPKKSGQDDYGQVDYSQKWDSAMADKADYNTLLGIYNDRKSKIAQGGVYSVYANDAKSKEMLAVLNSMKPQQTSTGNDYSPYIEDMNRAKREAALAALRAAYDKNVSWLNRAQDAIAPEYQSARNQAAGQAELQKKNFAEYANAQGLNSGAGGQAQLSFSNALQGNLSNISAKEASTMADLELQRSQMETDYNNAIAQAEAQGDYELAQQLYQEKVRQDEAMRQQMQWQAQMDLQNQQFQFSKDQATIGNEQWNKQFETGNQQYDQQFALRMAQEMAQYGDFDGYKAFGYSDTQIQGMKDYWNYLQHQTQARNTVTGVSSGGSSVYDPNELFQAAYDSGLGPSYIRINASKFGIQAGQIDGAIADYINWETGQRSSGNYDAIKNAVDSMLYNMGRQGLDNQRSGQQLAQYLDNAHAKGTITAKEHGKLVQYVARLMKLE